MPKYIFHEGEIELSVQWNDHSISAFTLPASDGTNDVSLVISRDRGASMTDLARYADQQIVESAKSLNEYQLLQRTQEQLSINGHAHSAITMDSSWLGPELTHVQQRQSILRILDYFLLITMTTTKSSFPQHAALWPQILGTLQLR